MKYLIKDDGYIYGFSDILAKRKDMRVATQKEVSAFMRRTKNDKSRTGGDGEKSPGR